MGHSSRAGENIFWAMNRNKPGIIKRILNALERFIARIRGKDAYLAVEQRQAAERLRDMLTGELKRAYGTEVKGEAAVESGGGKRHSLAGQYSQTAKLNSLSGAVRMNENGTPMDTIRARTGWWLGKDGKWRYEIDDSALSFDRNGYTDNAMYLADYVRHDKLFAAYPWLRGVKLKVADVVAENDNLNGLYNHHDDTIYLKDGRTDKQMKSTLLHELQHVIQEYEGFATGANPNAAAALLLNSAYNDLKRDSRFAKIKSPDEKMRIVKQYIERTTGNSFESQAQNYYYTNYGEQESRAVQERYAPTNDTGNDQIEVALYHNDGVIYDVSEEIDKAIDNLKEMGYNEKQVNSIIKRGIQNADLSGSGSESANSQNAWRRNNNGATEQSRGTGNEKRLGDGVRRRGDNQGTSETESSGRGVQRVLNEVSKPEKRFSLSSNVEQTKDLIAVHNMTAAELEKSLDLGGLPMPSIAIIKAADGHSEYGDVSLVFGKDTIDPKKSARNKVYGGDAWTPTFPKIDYKANEKVGKRIRDKYYDLSRKYGYDNTRTLYNYAQDLSDVLTSEGGEKAMIDKLYGDTGMMQIYLMDTGRERIANVNKETKTALTDGQVRNYENLIDTLGRDEMNGFAKKDGEELSDLVRRRKAFIEENEAGIRKAFEKTFIEDGMSAKDAAEVSAELALSDLRKYVLDTFNYIKNGAETVKTEFDSEATNAAIKKAADGEGYRKWVNDLFGGAEEKSGIRNSKDAYTASGNRRSFEALHWENNLENIVKAMLEQDETGGAFFSGTGIWGVSAKKYNSISEIKNDSSRLRTMNEAEYNALKEQYGARMQEIAQTLIDPKNDNYFIASDDAYSLIVDAVRNSKDESGILRYLKKYNSRATEKTASDIAALVRDIAEMPTGYFEAKPQRAVGFDEVKAVILPDNASGELVSRLESDGINTVTYKAGDENSRLEALNGVRDVRFSLARANGITTEITDDSYDEYEGGYQRRDIKLNGETVGTVAIRIYDDYSEIDRIDIDEKYRNKGIGTTVLGDIAGEFDTTYIVPDNESAKRLYERIGEEVTSGEVYENLDQGYGVYRLDKSYGNTRWSLAGKYDYSKSFADQIDDYKNGLLPVYDTFVVGETPKVWQDIGFNALPVTLNQTHVDYALNGTKDADHEISEADLKKLPEKIKEPIAIIQSQSNPSRAVVFIEMISKSKKNIVVPVEVDGYGTTNSITIDSNALTSLFGKNNAPKQLKDAIDNTVNGKTKLFYWDKKRSLALLHLAGLQLPGNLPQDGFVHSIREPGSLVKAKMDDVTNSLQFKRWFGDWKGGKRNVSKVVNRDGSPRVVYHYTDADFEAFDTSKSGSNQGVTHGDGIYVSTNPTEFAYAGKNRLDLYASIKKPFEMQLTKSQAERVYDKYFAPYHDDKYKTYRPHVIEKLQSRSRVFDYLSEAADNGGVRTSDILKELGYDGVHDGSEWVAFDSTQLKSATDNIGTFDKDNPKLKYSLAKSTQSELKALQKENEKLRQDVDDLKQELQLTHGRKLSRDALISSIQKILIDRYGVKLSAKELYPHVTNLFDMFYNNTVDGKRLKKDERVDTMRIIEEMDKIVDAVIENAVGVDDTYAEMKKLLPELRNTKLVVPMDARADAAQSAGFENWAEFRKANFGRVGFANEGLPVDTYYFTATHAMIGSTEWNS